MLETINRQFSHYHTIGTTTSNTLRSVNRVRKTFMQLHAAVDDPEVRAPDAPRRSRATLDPTAPPASARDLLICAVAPARRQTGLVARMSESAAEYHRVSAQLRAYQAALDTLEGLAKLEALFSTFDTALEAGSVAEAARIEQEMRAIVAAFPQVCSAGAPARPWPETEPRASRRRRSARTCRCRRRQARRTNAALPRTPRPRRAC